MKDFEILKQLVLAGSSSAEEALSFYHAAQERGLEFPLAWEEKVLEACLRKNPKRPDLQERLTKVYLAQGKKAESEFLGPPSPVASAQEAGEDHQAAAARYNLQSAYRDMEPEFHEIQARCRAYTMTSMERMYAMWQSVHHILNQGVPGAIVECGVWRGGSMMIAAHVLMQRGEANRDLYLFDTYEGLPRPDAEKDVDLWGNRAIDGWTPHARGSEQSDWARASQEDVEENLASTGYPRERLHLIKGMVEKDSSGENRIVANSNLDHSDIATRGSTIAVPGSAPQAAVQYTIVFDNADQQAQWYKFIKWLRSDPAVDGDTTAEKLINFIDPHMP